MTNLNNIPSTSADHSQQSALRRSISQESFFSRMSTNCFTPSSVISQTSYADDMRAPSNRLQDNALKSDTNSWKTILNDWINEPQADSEEKTNRIIAGKKIKDCITKRGRFLNLSRLGLSSLPPILHHCKALKNFNCNNNQLTQLNLKGCKTLTDLNCDHNQLTQLNLEDCNDLRHLACRVNELTQLNLEGRKALNSLCCSNNNQLTFNNLNFLLGMEDLSHIECSNTAIRWHLLPEAIRNNQAIYIDIRPQQARHQALNAPQNTHIESIHQCASQNATALKLKNSSQDLEQAYSDFCAWINQLPTKDAAIVRGYANTAFKHKAAKDWIASPRHLEHRDEASLVNVKEFLALAWRAAEDSAQREPHVLEAAAKEALVNALYEIRRGYNLDDAHNPKDNGAPARNICAGGTFNKISEKLVSVIQGVASVMITTETFSMSLIATIKRIVQDGLKTGREIDLKTDEDGDLFLTPKAWETIQEEVIASIKDEFKDYPRIAGKSLENHITEQTDFENALQYLNLNPSSPLFLKKALDFNSL